MLLWTFTFFRSRKVRSHCPTTTAVVTETVSRMNILIDIHPTHLVVVTISPSEEPNEHQCYQLLTPIVVPSPWPPSILRTHLHWMSASIRHQCYDDASDTSLTVNRVFYDLPVTQECQHCQLCFGCPMRNKVVWWNMQAWNLILWYPFKSNFTFTYIITVQ